MSFLGAAGAVLGGIGSIISAGDDASASKAATNAASQATAGQDQLTQQQLAIYQQLLQQYNQNVQPLQSGLGSQYAGLLGGDNSSSIAGADLNALQNPDSATGIDVSGLTSNALGYLSNPQATTSQQVGQPIVQSELAGAAGDTNLGAATPGAISSLLSGGVTGNGTSPGVGSTALNYYLNQAQNGGISQQLQQNALGQQQTGFDQNLADVRNSLGGTSNIGALTNQMTTQDEQARASLVAQMTGQSQQLETGAMGSALTAAQGIDNTTNANTQTALGDAGNLDTQSLQYMAQALQSAGGLDAQTLSMLTGAQSLGAGQEQTDIGNLNAAQSTNASLLAQIQNYLAQGQAGATGVATGLAGTAAQYGQAASTDANNAATLAGGSNPFSGLGTALANYAATSKAAAPATSTNNYYSNAVVDPNALSPSGVQISGDPTGLPPGLGLD
jgi:hypothetical protein